MAKWSISHPRRRSRAQRNGPRPRLAGLRACIRLVPALALGLLADPAMALNAFADGVEVYDSDPSLADLLVRDNVSIQGQLCVGATCTWVETYSSDIAAKLKTPDPSLDFLDTTTIANHPTTDWRIQINEAGSGALDRFTIRDLDAGTRPFTIEGGAPDNALWIRDSGLIGLGTSLPGADIHILTGLQPTIRLEQDGSAGQAPARWDIETRAADGVFAIRNADSGAIPLFIAKSTADNEIALNNDALGIGLSTGLPRAKLHVDLDTTDTTYPYGLLLGDGSETGIQPDLPGAMAHIISHFGHAQLKIEEVSGTGAPRSLLNLKNNGRPEIVMANTATGGEWSFGAGTNFVLKQGAVGSASSAKTKLFEIQPDGDAVLAGSLTTGGPTCSGGCDAVLEPGYALPTIADYAARTQALGHLPHVGPTLPGAPLNVGEKLGGLLNALEHAHLYIARLEAENRDQGDRIAALERQMADLAGARPAESE